MTLIKLGFEPKQKYKWKELPINFPDENYNEKIVVTFHKKLWGLVKVIIDMKKKGWDNIFNIDGRRRAGKSTLGFTIAYLLNPNLTINNFVSGLEEAPEKIDKAKDGDVLLFDEGSLVVGSKDAMSKQSKQLHKIIDVIGQKRLTLIFVMPSFLNISRQIIYDHSMFLIKVGVSKTTLQRGKFKVYKNKQMKQLYTLGKKDPRLMNKVKANFNGKFVDFHLPFEKDYFKLKRASMQEAIDPTTKKKEATISPLIISKIKTELMINFKQNCPDVPDRIICNGFSISRNEYYRRKRGYQSSNE